MSKVNLQKSARNLSPLSLLVLAACGGEESFTSGPVLGPVSGNIIHGPLFKALVGLDTDSDGVVDTDTVYTGEDGGFSISTSSSTYTIIAVTDDETFDTSSGTFLSGVTLKAPQGATVVTPTTTLMQDGDLTAAEVAAVLGLPEGVDPLTFNPFDIDETDPAQVANALAVEKISVQIMSAVTAFAATAEGAGASEADAFSAALNSIVEVVKAKAAKLTDETASDAQKSLDLTSATDLAEITAQAKIAAGNTAGVNTDAFDALADATATSVKNVNDAVEEMGDLTSDASTNILNIVQLNADDIKGAVTDEANSAGSGSIAFTDADEVTTAVNNAAPEAIALSENEISEDASSLVIGVLSTTDSDQPDGVAFTYALAGADADYFIIDQTTGQLSLKAQPDYETKESYSISVLSTDEGGKTFVQGFTITVGDANDAPVLADVASEVSGSAGSYTATGALTATDQDGDDLTYTATDGTGSYGSVVVSASGAYVYTLDEANEDVLALAHDASLTDTFTVTVSDGNGGTATSDLTITIYGSDSGYALKGPLEGAIAFNDYNGDGVLTDGESWVETASDGSYALLLNSNLDASASYDTSGFDYDDYSVVISMENATDSTSGESYADAGTTLKAAPGGGIVTPMTTLHEHSEEHATDFAADDLAEALGLDSTEVDILTFNTHAADVDADLAHEVESIQQHLMTTTMMVQAAIKGVGTPGEGTAVSDVVAHDAALDSLINLIIEVHKANTEVGGSEAVSITGDLDLSDHEHLEALETLIEADLADTSAGALGATMAANGTSVPVPVLEYVLEHASTSINLVNTALDALSADDFGGVNAGAVSHLKHDVADEIQEMATAARAYYDEWVTANPDDTFDTGTANSETGVLEGGDWADFDADSYLTLNTTSAINTKIIANKAIVAEHLGQTELTLFVPEGQSVTEDAAANTITGTLKGFNPENDTLSYTIVGQIGSAGSVSETGTYGTLQLNASTGVYTYTLNNEAAATDALKSGIRTTETFSVQVTDGTNSPEAQNLTFTIIGAPAAPTNVQFVASSSLSIDGIDENASGILLGSATSVAESSNVSYDLGQNPYSKLQISTSTGEVTLSSPWDYETDGGTISFTIIASSYGESADAVSVNFAVTDVKEAPKFGSGLQDEASSVATEGSAFEFAFSSGSSLLITDEDEGDDFSNLTFTLGDDAPDWLSIDKTSNYVKLVGTPTLESDVGSFDVVLTASDGEASNDFTIILTVEAVNDAPQLTMVGDEATITVGAGEVGPDVLTPALYASDEENATSDLTFFILNADGEKVTQTATFEISGGKLKFLDSVTTPAGQSFDVTIVAQDTDGAYSNEASVQVAVGNTNLRPEIDSFSAATTSGVQVVGSGIITISAVTSEPVYSSDTESATFDATLRFSDSEVQTLTFTRDANDRTLFTTSITVNSQTPNSGGIELIGYNSGTVVDVSGSTLIAATLTDSPVALGIGVDTEAPSASVTVNQSTSQPLYTIDTVADTATLTLTINEVDELGFEDGADVSTSFDFTMLSWGVDDSQDEVPFLDSYIDSAVLSIPGDNNNTGSLAIVLSDAGRSAIESLSGFGGSVNLDTLDVGSGFLVDIAGNNSAAIARPDIEIEMSDSQAPVLTSISVLLTDSNGNGYANNSETLTFTATLSEAVKSGTVFSVDLNTGDTVTFTAASNTNIVESAIVLGSDFSDFAVGSLSVTSYTVSSSSDVHGNLLIDDTAIDGFDNLSNSSDFARDTEAPSASVTVNQSTSQPLYTIDTVADTATLTLTINEVDELGFEDGADVSTSFDFTMLSWGVDDSQDEVPFLDSYIDSAVLSIPGDINNTGSLAIVLSDAGRSAIESLSGFGGSVNLDTLDVGSGFLVDIAGNNSAAIARPDIEIEMSDSQAPVLTSITASSESSSPYGIGDQITITTSLSEAVSADAELTFNLSNDKTVTATRSEDDTTLITAVYAIETGEDTEGLSILSYSVASGSVDAHGNEIDPDTTVESIAAIGEIVIDATAPYISVSNWNNISDVIDLVFSEELSSAAQDGVVLGLQGLPGVADDEVGVWTQNDDGDSVLSIGTSADADAENVVTNSIEFSIEDLTGNITNISEIDFSIIA
ncbi:VCBS domain-containing protein [Ascidiaceihabitans sp.]|nr:VCBS domain-containing protein [Ascidiaceihabitans sp.]